VPTPVAALLLAAVSAALVAVALLAGRAGAWVATPPAGPAPTLRPPAITPPSVGISAATPPPETNPQPPSAAWLIISGLVVAGVLLLMLVIWLVRVLRRPGTPVAGTPHGHQIGSPIALASALEPEDAVEDTDARTFDPRVSADAIIACWASLEVAAAAAGSPRLPASTPTEFLSALEARYPPPPDEESGDRLLLRLYHRARFDTGALAPGAASEAAAAAAAIRRRFPRAAVPASVGPPGTDRDRP
jgi:hypothetical protein